MLNFKPVQVIQRGQKHIGLQIEWSAVSKSDDYDGLDKFDYVTDVVFAIHAIPSESAYYGILMELFQHFNGRLNLFHVNGEGVDDLVRDISMWLVLRGFLLI